MELKLRKRINNRLPGFHPGLNPNVMKLKITNPMTGAAAGAASGAGAAGGAGSAVSGASKGGFGSFMQSAAPYMQLAQFAGAGIAEGLGAMRTTSDMIADAGTTEGTVNGISYEKSNTIDVDQTMKDYNKLMGMKALTNPIAALTMLAGRRREKRRAERARQQQLAMDQANRASAASDYLQQLFYDEYGDQSDQILYAKNGKDSVYSAYGELPINPNSRVEDGEIIYNAQESTAKVVPGNQKGDKNLSMLKPEDAVITNKFGLSAKGRQAAKALESLSTTKKNRGLLGKLTDELIKSQATRVLDNIAAEQQQLREVGLLKNTNKLPKYAGGKSAYMLLAPSVNPANWGIQDIPLNGKLAELDLSGLKPLDVVDAAIDAAKEKKTRFPKDKRSLSSNWWIDSLGVLGGLGQAIGAATQKIKRTNTYRSNPYEKLALNKLASLRVDPYPIMKEMYDLDRRNRYTIDNMGGLSSAQRQFANIASGIGTQRNIGSILADILKQNNQYKTTYATTAMNAGQADRTARMAANQYDLDYYTKAHAAKQQMIEQGLYNSLAALQQGYKNWNKNKQFNRMMALYGG